MVDDTPTCNECGQWTPTQFRTVDETREGSRYVLCQDCDAQYPGLHDTVMMRH